VGANTGKRLSVLMLLENNPYPHDIRVRREAETLVGAGHRVTVVAPRRLGQPKREVVDGVRVRRFRLREGGGVKGLLAEYAVAHCALFLEAIRGLAMGCDVVHVHNPPDTLFPVGMLARAFGRKFVYDHHDLAAELYADKFGSGRLVGLLGLAQRASARVAHRTLVANESQAVAVSAARADASARTTVVRNGPLRATLAKSACGRAGELRNPELVFVGTLESQDGVFDLPELMQAVDEELGSTGARLTIVGDGTSRAELERRFAAAPSLADRVRITGRVPHEHVAGLIAAADIAIDPAPGTPLNHQSTMIKIGEYLAAGRPTVAYRLRETEATGGNAVCYADCGDVRGLARAIAELALDEKLRQAAAERALARAPELVWERSAEALESVYDELAAA
jgi:glycosyltransferase involved in cell wall biosynthesis